MKHVKVIVVGGKGAGMLDELLDFIQLMQRTQEQLGEVVARPTAPAELQVPDLKADPDFYLKPDVPKVAVTKKASASEPGRNYLVSVDVAGNLYCECKGFRYRGTCRHVKSVKSDGFQGVVDPKRIGGFALCINCQHFRRDIPFVGRLNCGHPTVLNCPPREGCVEYVPFKLQFGPKAPKGYPMTFPVDGELVQDFESYNHPGVHYEVRIHEGELQCSCRGFQFHGSCKHVRFVKERIAKPTIRI